MNRKALALLSGGLDSILAIKVLQEQGVEVEAVNFAIKFASCMGGDSENFAGKAASSLKVPLKTVDISEEYIALLKNPKHGFGANVNPCIDCKIFMLKKAKEMMKDTGASFLVTGEVLGERPMSQRRDALNIIERDAGVRGILLRPLSAKLLNPTVPEDEGVVDRKRLLDIRGRSRKPQIALAAKFGIRDYPQPAGGCLLTDPGFARRVKDLIAHNMLDTDNLKLASVGRHFRLSKDAKLVVGRDKEENEILQSLAKPDDIIFKLKNHQGPISILRGSAAQDLIKKAASVIAYHTKFRNEENLSIDYWKGSGIRTTLSVQPDTIKDVENIRI